MRGWSNFNCFFRRVIWPIVNCFFGWVVWCLRRVIRPDFNFFRWVIRSCVNWFIGWFIRFSFYSLFRWVVWSTSYRWSHRGTVWPIFILTTWWGSVGGFTFYCILRWIILFIRLNLYFRWQSLVNFILIWFNGFII